MQHNLDPLLQAGLLGPTSERDAAMQGLFALTQQIGARGAPRLSPTPPPLDLGAAQRAYQSALNADLKRGLLRRKLKQEADLKKMLMPLTPQLSEVNKATSALVNPIAQRREAQMMADANMAQDPLTADIDFPKTDAAFRETITPAIQSKVTDVLSTPKMLRGMPEGQKNLVQSLAGAGYGEQAISAALKFASKTDGYDVVKIGKNSYGKINKTTGEVTPITQDENNDVNWDGTSITAQALNTLNRMAPLVRNRTANPQQMRAYEQAAAILMRGKTVRSIDDDGNETFMSVPGMPLNKMNLPVTPTMAEMAAKSLGTKMPKDPSADVKKIYGFGQTMGSAGKILSDLEFGDENFRMPFIAEAFGDEGALARFLTRKTLNSAQQRYLQAANQWITAILRRESGAAISIPEARKYFDIYFPLPGQGPALVKQKREARALATETMKAQGIGHELYLKQLQRRGMKKTGGTPGSTVKPTITLEEIKNIYGLPGN